MRGDPGKGKRTDLQHDNIQRGVDKVFRIASKTLKKGQKSPRERRPKENISKKKIAR